MAVNSTGGYLAPMTAPEAKYRQLADALMSSAHRTPITTGGLGGLAQLGGNLAQIAVAHFNANRADKERQAHVDKINQKIGSLNVPEHLRPLVSAFTEIDPMAGLDLAGNILTQSPDEDLVQVVDESGRKVWKRKSEAAGLQSDFPEAGKTRERYSGSTAIQEEFDPASGQWVEIGRGGRWAPSQPVAQTPKSLTERVWETLINGDPNAPEYALAYQEATKPQAQTGVNEQGQQIVTYITPELPPNIRRPSYMGQPTAPAAASSVPQPPSAAPGASGPHPRDRFSAAASPTTSADGRFSTSTPIVTGVSSKRDQPLTEDQRKNLQLYERATPQLKIVEENFDSLANIWNQTGALAPIAAANFITSAGYQRASNAVYDIAASYLYSVSGATATEGEVKKLVSTILPTPNESAASIADKKARIQQMVESIRIRAQGNLDGGAVGGSLTDNGDGSLIWSPE